MEFSPREGVVRGRRVQQLTFDLCRAGAGTEACTIRWTSPTCSRAGRRSSPRGPTGSKSTQQPPRPTLCPSISLSRSTSLPLPLPASASASVSASAPAPASAPDSASASVQKSRSPRPHLSCVRRGTRNGGVAFHWHCLALRAYRAARPPARWLGVAAVKRTTPTEPQAASNFPMFFDVFAFVCLFFQTGELLGANRPQPHTRHRTACTARHGGGGQGRCYPHGDGCKHGSRKPLLVALPVALPVIQLSRAERGCRNPLFLLLFRVV